MDKTADSYDLASERADLEAVIEMVGSLKQRWQKRLPKEVQRAYYVEGKRQTLDVWEALRIQFSDPGVITCMGLSRALEQLNMTLNWLQEQAEIENLDLTLVRTKKRNLRIKPHRDTAAREQADLTRPGEMK